MLCCIYIVVESRQTPRRDGIYHPWFFSCGRPSNLLQAKNLVRDLHAESFAVILYHITQPCEPIHPSILFRIRLFSPMLYFRIHRVPTPFSFFHFCRRSFACCLSFLIILQIIKMLLNEFDNRYAFGWTIRPSLTGMALGMNHLTCIHKRHFKVARHSRIFLGN